MPHLRVVQPGLMSTVQDLGRAGYSSLGVPAGGALDALSLRAGNRCVGNPDDAAAIEITLTGASFELDADVLIALGGGSGVVVRMARAGEKLDVDAPSAGCRTYLCVRGGIDVPVILGARSTCLVGGFGGHEGRALRAGDALSIGEARRAKATCEPSRASVAWLRGEVSRRIIRVMCASDVLLNGAEFRVSARSDRAGVRLTPVRKFDALRSGSAERGRMISEGTPLGGIQMPPGGEPIILLNDRPVTGGYPLIGCIASADLPAVAQARPGDALRFESISIDAARTLRREQEAALDRYFTSASERGA